MLGMVLRGTLGRSGRKRSRRALRFLTGHKGFLSASTIIGAAGVAWGIYDTLANKNTTAVGGVAVPNMPAPAQPVPPLPVSGQDAADPVTRVIRLAVSAARADGTLDEQERAVIMARAKEAGLEAIVEAELNQTRPLSEIVAGVTDQATKNELYVLAFTIVRADENVSGAERIYLAQLAAYLGLDPAATQALETETAAKIDSETDN
jgi:uncharacterized membrane protein YebE (DUF533 family)